MLWNRERYRQEVLEPARVAGNVVPADLYLRYCLPRGISDPVAFTRQIAEVINYWDDLARKRTYAALAGRLIAAHALLERAGPLTRERLAALDEKARRERQDELARLAQSEASAATHVGPATVARLAAALGEHGKSVTDAEVREALRQAGVTVIDVFPPLPATAHPKQADLAKYVQQLEWRLSAEVVFGEDVRQGFRVLDGFQLNDGRTLDATALAKAQGDAAKRPYSDATTAPAQKALAIMREVAGVPGGLDALVLGEIVERLRKFAVHGFLQRAVAAHAADLGLVADDAGVLAAAVLAGDTLEAVRQQVEAELQAGRLRAAQRLATGLPSKDELRSRVAAADAEVAAQVSRADAELAKGRREAAALCLASAISVARDDIGLAGRLTELPPPAPRNATASANGQHVLVRWESSPARAGRVRYRIRRGQGRSPASPAEGIAVALQPDEHQATDTEAPTGAELIYSVFADRGGEACSAPAVTEPFVFAPDVASVSVTVTETSVAASWQPHAGAARVRVVRREGQEPVSLDDGTEVPASLTGFADQGLNTGTEYFYRVAAIYRVPGDQRRQSGGVLVRGTPAPEPDAVTDLSAHASEDYRPGTEGLRIAIAWTPPRHGQVRLVMADQPPPWTPGARVSPAEAAGLTSIAATQRRDRDGRDILDARLPFGRHYLLALTVAESAVVAGNTVKVMLVEPASGLFATRLHDLVSLGWEWPKEAAEALVSWPGGEHRCTRRAYKDEGGVTVTIGPGQTTIKVFAVYPDSGDRISAPAATVDVPARRIAVSYRIRRRWLRPRWRIITFIPERAARLPPLVIVRTTGPYAPDDPAEGETVGRIRPQPIAPAQPVKITVKAPRGSGWLACFVDSPAAGSDGDGILLFQPPASEMRIS